MLTPQASQTRELFAADRIFSARSVTFPADARAQHGGRSQHEPRAAHIIVAPNN